MSDVNLAQKDFNPFLRDPQYFEKPDIGLVRRMYSEILALAEQPKILIIDASHWNENLDVDAIIASGVVAIILKCSEGEEDSYYEYKDINFEVNWRKCLDAGLIVMVYHFARDGRGSQEKSWFMKCADEFLQAVDGKTAVWLDSEWDGGKITPLQRGNRHFAFCDLILGEGITQSGIYSSVNYVNKLYAPDENRWGNVWLWNAHWTPNKVDTLPRNWPAAKRIVWQFGIYPTYYWAPVVNGAGTVDVNWGYWEDGPALRSWLKQSTPDPENHLHPDLQEQINEINVTIANMITEGTERDAHISANESAIGAQGNRLDKHDEKFNNAGNALID